MIELVGWSAHQHYHERRAPWIKQYVKLLDDPTYRCLSHGARSLLNDLWMLGPTTKDGVIRTVGGKPAASSTLAWLLREDAESVDAWLREIADVRDEHDAPRWIILRGGNELRPVLASRKQDASKMLATETETETETEEETALHPTREVTEAELVVRESLPRPEYVTAFGDLLREAEKPDSLAASVRGFGPGGIHQCATWDDLGHALMDLAAAPGKATPLALRAFIRRIQAGDPPARSSPGPRQTQLDRNLAVVNAVLAEEEAA